MIQIEFLTAEELSRILRVPKTTLYTLSQQGKIPALKVGRHWRYMKSSLKKWLEDSHKSNYHEKVFK